MQDQVEKVLDEIRSFLRVEGGDVEVVEVNDGVVKVKLMGACGCCAMSTMTLHNVIERLIKERLPEVKEVVAV